MDSINTLRAVLVAGAVVAAIGAFMVGETLAGVVMVVAVAAHGWMWFYLHQLHQRRRAGAVSDDLGARPAP